MSSLSDFRTVWSVDFEFRPERGREGNPLDIVCMVAKSWPAGDEVRIWLHGATSPVSCPFAPEDLIVAFYASAEMGCFQALGWPAPKYVLDLYAEFRKHTNGKTIMCGNGLIGALTYFGCDAIPSDEKDAMRAFILKGGPWNASDQEKILDYCATDVDATLQLLTAMEPHIDLPRALLRGAYTIGVASMERRGIPIDVQTLDQLRLKWPRLKQELIKQVDQAFGVYQDGAFRQVQFSQYLKNRNISWPRTKSGQLALDDETFKEQVQLHPQLEPLHQLRKTLSKSRLGEWRRRQKSLLIVDVCFQNGAQSTVHQPFYIWCGVMVTRSDPANRRTRTGLYRLVVAAAGLLRAKAFSWRRCAQETLDIYRTVSPC